MSTVKTCKICGGERAAHCRYCARCQGFIKRFDRRRGQSVTARVRALKSAWKGDGFYCYYTKTKLEETDSQRPLHITFDHRTPGNEQDIVATSALVNDIKGDMTEEEFRPMIKALADNFANGTPIPEKCYKPKYWRR